MSSLEWVCIGFGALMSLILVVQDFRGRSISVLPTVLMGCAGGVYRAVASTGVWWQEILGNAVIFALVLGMMGLIMRVIRPGRKVLNEQFGAGDVLYLFMMVGWWDPVGMMLWLVTGLVALLLVMTILIVTKRVGREYPIPLAGVLAGYSLVYFPVYLSVEKDVWALAGSWIW